MSAKIRTTTIIGVIAASVLGVAASPAAAGFPTTPPLPGEAATSRLSRPSGALKVSRSRTC